jgi:2'-hydroxyisoflavone reductase
VARCAAAPDDPLLVPATPDLPTAVVDVRDLVGWLLDAAQSGVSGTYDTVGPAVAFGEWVALSRQVGGHVGEVVEVPGEWLVEQGVEQFMGPESVAMWLVEQGYEGWSSRSGQAAAAAGLRHRPREQLLADVLAWERSQGLDRERAAGLSADRERALLAAWRRRG